MVRLNKAKNMRKRSDKKQGKLEEDRLLKSLIKDSAKNGFYQVTVWWDLSAAILEELSDKDYVVTGNTISWAKHDGSEETAEEEAEAEEEEEAETAEDK